MSKWIKEIIVRYDDKQSFIYGNTLGEVVGELVRCKECVWRDKDNQDEDYCTYVKGLADINEDSFCSYGERREP